jgi:type IV secretory pathway VirB10-like protein
MAENKSQGDAFALDAGVPAIEGSIRPKPRFADRISKRVLGVVLLVLVLIAGVFMLALNQMDERKLKPSDSTAPTTAKPGGVKLGDNGVPKDLTDAPAIDGAASSVAARSSLVTPSSPPPASDTLALDKGGVPSLSGAANPSRSPSTGPTGQPDLSKGGLPASQGLPLGGAGAPTDNGLGRGSMTVDAPAAVNASPTPEEMEARAAKADRAKRMSQARTGGLGGKAFEVSDTKGGASALSSNAVSSLMSTLQHGANTAPSALPIAGQAGQKPDSEQDEKTNFIKTAGKGDQTYLQSTTMPAVSKNELQRGSYLPLRLDAAINSGQPGMVKARVTEDVYDTVSGCRLLIPAMTVVQGTYDSKVAVGQTRNLVVWNYMGFEDGSHLDLGAMEGYDSSGAAGIEADVDNHYFKLFGLAFGMSLVTAGVQQSQPPVPTGTTAQTPEQSLATSLAQQYGQLGAQIIGKQMQVQPTLKNYAGERFVIMLPLNVVFKKVWRARC